MQLHELSRTETLTNEPIKLYKYLMFENNELKVFESQNCAMWSTLLNFQWLHFQVFLDATAVSDQWSWINFYFWTHRPSDLFSKVWKTTLHFILHCLHVYLLLSRGTSWGESRRLPYTHSEHRVKIKSVEISTRTRGGLSLCFFSFFRTFIKHATTLKRQWNWFERQMNNALMRVTSETNGGGEADWVYAQ